MVYLVEDEWKNFYPLSLLRPLFEIKAAKDSFLKRLKKFYKDDEIRFIVKDELIPIVTKNYPGYSINELKNERAIILKANVLLYERIESKTDEIFIDSENEVIGVSIRLPKQPISLDKARMMMKEKFNIKKVNAKKYSYPWEIIRDIERLLSEELTQREILGTIGEGTWIYGKNNFCLGKGSVIEGGVVIDARKGPVHIGENVIIKGPTSIEGPTYIGNNSIIDGAKIRSGTSIGKTSRIGGEIEATIIHGYSNKHHEGFIGHSYIGEWVNLGALTTNSDLKNNYSPVKVKILGKEFQTGLLKFGSIIGEHVKTAIGTLIPTGCVIGIFANVLSHGMCKKEIPSFAWGEDGVYELDKLFLTLERVMQRRGKSPTPELIELIKILYAKYARKA